MNLRRSALALGLGLLLTAAWTFAQEQQAEPARLAMRSMQKDYLTFEPIIVKLALLDKSLPTLPVEVGSESGLRFDVKPAVKVRAKAKPLAAEVKRRDLPRQERLFDLLEWYEFPAEGTFTVQAIHEDTTGRRVAAPVTFTIRRPTKEDGETGPVARLHHLPWSNYVTDAFCGDTFDLVKQWPKSKLAKYGHYWSGLHLQHKKEYEKALASFRIVVEQYPDFVLADHARLGISECTTALAQAKAASK